MTPTSPKVAAIGACGLCTVTRTGRDLGEAVEDGVGDRAGGGFDQAVAPAAERPARHVDDLVVADGMRELVRARGLREVDIEREVELERLADLGLVLHHAVVGVQREPGDEDGVGHRAPPMAAATLSACTVSATSWVRTIAGAVGDRDQVAGDRAAEALVGRRGRDRVDEALARGADQERQAERFELREPRDGGDALLRRLAEADAGVEHDALARDAGAVGDLERAGKERRDVGHDVDGRIGGLAVVHDDDRHGVLGHHARHVGIALQAPDVVDDRRAGGERRKRHLAPSWCRSTPARRAP